MKISEQKLREAVARAVKRVLEESGSPAVPAQALYVVETASLRKKYQSFLDSVRGRTDLRVIPVAPEGGGPEPGELAEGCIVFPDVPQDLVIRAALCMSDTFETRWIRAGIRQGRPVCFLLSGLEPFTGKEPKAYQEQILGYYRKVMEYGILIAEGIPGPRCRRLEESGEGAGSAGSGAPVAGQAGTKRVISLGSLYDEITGNTLYLNPGDIITDLAREEALRRQIKIVKSR